MALALGPDGAWYVTMGNAGFNNAYWEDEEGTRHYSPDKRRGCLLRIGTEGKVEQLASGLRYVMSMQINKHGDLFATDQEGATWVPNGNPFDELLHVQPGRHYGFPPRGKQQTWLARRPMCSHNAFMNQEICPSRRRNSTMRSASAISIATSAWLISRMV